MIQKVGRPKKEESKKVHCSVRLNENKAKELDEICDILDVNRSEALTLGLKYLRRAIHDGEFM